jgi:7-cyano-7-deazaguanine reductase
MSESSYTEQHARSESETPQLEVFPNQRTGRDYHIRTEVPEFTSMCPKTGQPDYGTITITYVPDELCIELKSLKFYMQAFRNMGIFYENVTNRILEDIVAACKPRRCVVEAAFTPRGGISTTVRVEYPYLEPGTAAIEPDR